MQSKETTYHRRINTKKDSPSEVKFPVEAAPGHVRGRDVLKGLVGDDVNDGTHHAGPARRRGESGGHEAVQVNKRSGKGEYIGWWRDTKREKYTEKESKRWEMKST